MSVRFSSKKPLQINKWDAGATTVGAPRTKVVHGDFKAEATVHAEADTAAEIADWEVGFLQTNRVTWNRTYWRRDNADGRGKFLERKLKVPKAPLRDHRDDTVVWAAPGEFAAVPAGSASADLTVKSSDRPKTSRHNSGKDATGADATDGTDNLYQLRVGYNFISFVSARNKTTGEFRHLELAYWSLQTSVDFKPKTGGGIETTRDDRQLGKSRRFRWSTAADQPVVGGTRTNPYINDPGNITVRRVDGWT